MFDDRNTRLGFGPDGTTLDSLSGVVEGLLESPFADGDAFHADAHAGHVHHREHVPHPLLLVTDEIANGTLPFVAVRHHTGRGGVDAELVLERDDFQVVSLTWLPVLVEDELGDEEH